MLKLTTKLLRIRLGPMPVDQYFRLGETEGATDSYH